MAIYPTEPKVRASGSSDKLNIPTIRTESENAYTKVRRKTTRTKSKFKLSYRSITEAEYTILQTFFNTNQGLAFTFVHPATTVSYNCIFSQDDLDKTYKDGVLVSTEISIEEI